MAEPDATPGRERGRDLDRLLTFVDAIVAIAITLLILPLVDVAREVGVHGSVWSVVRDHAGEFGGFALTFVVIARLWLAQHRVVRDAVEASALTTGCLIAWSFTIVFLPFPSALLADVGQQAATKVFYLGTLTASSAILALLAWAVHRNHPGLHRGGPSRIAPPVITAVLFGAALVVCLLVPPVNYYAVLLLFLAGPVEAYLHRRAQRGSA